jgi:hypothetical protein
MRVLVLTLVASLAAAQGPIVFTVQSGRVQAVGCTGLQSASLPTGPLVTPLGASASFETASASVSLAPLPAVIGFTTTAGISAFCPWSTHAIATVDLSLGMRLVPPQPGTYWIRIVWEASIGSEFSGASWTVASTRPGGFTWTENRASLPGYPLYLDVPVDLLGTETFTLTFRAAAAAGRNGPFPPYYAGSASGQMRFLFRRTPPLPVEPFGAACRATGGGIPAGLIYDPFGIGREPVEGVLVCDTVQNRPAFLWLGLSRDFLGSLSLPLDLTPFGAPGCFLLQDLQLVLPAMTNSRGVAGVPLLTTAQLTGLPPLYCQWMIPDPGNPLGLVWSNGFVLRAP